MKFDDFLEKLFHTRLGWFILVSAAVSLLLLICSCSNQAGEVCGCKIGCTKYACVNTGGCDCDPSCGGDLCGTYDSCTICGYKCSQTQYNCEGRVCNDDSVNVIVELPFGMETETHRGSENRLDKWDKFIYGGENTQLDFLMNSAYFEIDGFYDGDEKILDAQARIIEPNELKSRIKKHEITLTLKATEKKAGEKILVKFSSSYEELILNSVMVLNGSVVDYFPTPSIEGKTFVGWRIAGTNNEPEKITAGTTVFHLYTLNAPLENTVTLEPVFK